MLLSKATYSAFRIYSFFFFVSMCVPWEFNPQPFALLMKCSTTEPQEHRLYVNEMTKPIINNILASINVANMETFGFVPNERGRHQFHL